MSAIDLSTNAADQGRIQKNQNEGPKIVVAQRMPAYPQNTKKKKIVFLENDAYRILGAFRKYKKIEGPWPPAYFLQTTR